MTTRRSCGPGEPVLCLVDGTALVYRSYYAFIRRPLVNSDGENVSAVYGFASSLIRLLDERAPSHMVVAFDRPEPTFRHEAYEDRPVPIGRGQTISQPYVVAVMLQELDVKETDCVLDVGAGSGYQTALLARLAKHVYAIERIDALAERAMTALTDVGARNVTMKVADGSLGWPEKAPFDAIICGAGAPDVPEAWGNQLVDGGRIVLPVGQAHAQSLVVVGKTGGKLHRRRVCDVRFVKLIGKHAWPE